MSADCKEPRRPSSRPPSGHNSRQSVSSLLPPPLAILFPAPLETTVQGAFPLARPPHL